MSAAISAAARVCALDDHVVVIPDAEPGDPRAGDFDRRQGRKVDVEQAVTRQPALENLRREARGEGRGMFQVARASAAFVVFH